MSLMTVAVELESACEDAGAPAEFLSHIDKVGLAGMAFDGTSNLDLTAISSGEYTALKGGMVNGGVPAEAIAQLEKIKAAIVT